MSRFSHPNFNAQVYAESRPYYNDIIFNLLQDFHSKRNDCNESTCVDLGCGPGNGTFTLSNMFKKTYAVDPSATMINEGKKRPGSRNLNWVVGSGEVSLITSLTTNLSNFKIKESS